MTMEFHLEDFFNVEKCVDCGKCLVECPVFKYSEQKAIEQHKKLVCGEPGDVLNNCSACYSCDTFCPNGCKPYGLIMYRWYERYREKGIPGRALGGLPVPKSWEDLLKPEYKGMVGYLDPSSAFVGYAGAVAINRAMGGSLDNFTPAIKYFKALSKNDPIIPKQTSYARVLSGEIPILLDYDFNAYRAKYKDKADVVFVIPTEGTIVVPYVMSLVKGAPHPELGKKILDFVLSDKGQTIWANAFLRPVRASAMSKEAASKFLPASEYARAKPVDYSRMAAVQNGFTKRYLAEVR